MLQACRYYLERWFSNYERERDGKRDGERGKWRERVINGEGERDGEWGRFGAREMGKEELGGGLTCNGMQGPVRDLWKRRQNRLPSEVMKTNQFSAVLPPVCGVKPGL